MFMKTKQSLLPGVEVTLVSPGYPLCSQRSKRYVTGRDYT